MFRPSIKITASANESWYNLEPRDIYDGLMNKYIKNETNLTEAFACYNAIKHHISIYEHENNSSEDEAEYDVDEETLNSLYEYIHGIKNVIQTLQEIPYSNTVELAQENESYVDWYARIFGKNRAQYLANATTCAITGESFVMIPCHPLAPYVKKNNLQKSWLPRYEVVCWGFRPI